MDRLGGQTVYHIFTGWAYWLASKEEQMVGKVSKRSCSLTDGLDGREGRWTGRLPFLHLVCDQVATGQPVK